MENKEIISRLSAIFNDLESIATLVVGNQNNEACFRIGYTLSQMKFILPILNNILKETQ